ncbi:MAG: class I SAM-dependent methyltransferase [Marmoricola sp.]
MTGTGVAERRHGRSPTPLLVNLGSGQHGPQTWVNFDRSPSMLLRRFPVARGLLRRAGVINEFQAQGWDPHIQRRDLVRPLPFAGGTVDAIYSSHFLEHVFLTEAETVLREAYRVLRAGGILRLALPDGERWARELVEAGDDPTGEAGRLYQERLGAHPDARPTGRHGLTFGLGGFVHRWQPTRGLVRSMLQRAGFADTAERKFREGELPDLDRIENREESFFYEARK